MTGRTLIRPRTEADTAALVATLRATHAADGYPVRARAVGAAFLAPDRGVGAWVAEQDGVAVGHVALVHTVEEPALVAATGLPASRLAAVARLFVDPGTRGSGLGRALLETACAAARDGGWQPVLDVVDGAPAVQLYERLGWRLAAVVPARWLADDGTRPAVRLYVGPQVTG